MSVMAPAPPQAAVRSAVPGPRSSEVSRARPGQRVDESSRGAWILVKVTSQGGDAGQFMAWARARTSHPGSVAAVGMAPGGIGGGSGPSPGTFRLSEATDLRGEDEGPVGRFRLDRNRRLSRRAPDGTLAFSLYRWVSAEAPTGDSFTRPDPAFGPAREAGGERPTRRGKGSAWAR
jgi:hypothetical protein